MSLAEIVNKLNLLEGLINEKVIEINKVMDIKEKENIYMSLKENIQFLFENGENINKNSEYSGKKYILEDLRMSCDMTGFMYSKLPEFIIFLEDCGLNMEKRDFNDFMMGQFWVDREESNAAFKWMCERYDYELNPEIITNLLNINPYFEGDNVFEVLFVEKADGLFRKKFLEVNTIPYYLFDRHDNLSLIKYVVDKYKINLSLIADEDDYDLLEFSTFETTVEYLFEKGLKLREENRDDYDEIIIEIAVNHEKNNLKTMLDSSESLTPVKALPRI